MELPQQLRTAVEAEVSALPGGLLAKLADGITCRYRTNAPGEGRKFLTTADEVAAYAAFRLPSTYAAVKASLLQAKERLPQWAPQSQLDVGAGPGTALWAASSVWPMIKEFTAMERDDAMMALGRRLGEQSPLPALQEAQWLKADITGQWDTPAHSLVTASYVLGELAQQSGALVRRLWEKTQELLVIVEPGTQAGYANIMQARSLLLSLGASIIAPCPHGQPCPMAGDWCHFSQRVARSRLHRQLKGAELSYEDEKYSYLCAAKRIGSPINGRVIRHPQTRKGHVCLKLCTVSGLEEKTISRKDGELYKRAKDLSWGDGF